MAKYNAAKHTIETDTGELLATLTHSVRADEGFTIADNWGDSVTKELRDQIEDLDAEIGRIEYKNDELRDEIRDLERENNRLAKVNGEATDRIEELEAKLNKKGDAQ